MGKVFGLPYRLLVLVMGLVIAVLSITGVVIWWRKRRGRRAVPAEAAAAATPAPHMREDLA
jgi:uncharacterized iron-regulated membrane protein